MFTHVHHHPDSTTVRSFTDLLLIPEAYYAQNLVNESEDSTFWSLWIRDALPALEYAANRYYDFASATSNKNPMTAAITERWKGYLSFISKTRHVLGEIGKGIDSGQLQPMNSILVANPKHELHRMIVGGFMFLVFASDFDPGPGDLRITRLEAFYLIASELEGSRKIESVQRLALEDSTSKNWKAACLQVRDVSIAATNEAKKDPTDTFLGPKAWVTAKAEKYCEEIGVLTKRAP
ncbi:MAG: hypothetical protein EOP05_12755 [Proteobacteria bacterium]|nr:MAG: hypothetical protein EOP05_12755 [Pseudomonadota bacterium]